MAEQKKKSLAPKPSDLTEEGTLKPDPVKSVAYIRVKDRWTSLAVNSIPIKEAALVRRETGLPLDVFCDMGSFGTDSLKVLFWLGRRANGESFLMLGQVEAEWPKDLTFDDWDVTTTKPDEVGDDDPEQ